MSKKNGFLKFFVFCAIVGAAAATAYYFLTKRDASLTDDFDDDDFDDFEDFEDEDDDAPEFKFGSRKYVDIKSKDADEEDSDDEGLEEEDLDVEDLSDDRAEDLDSSEDTATKSEEFFDDEK